MANDPIHQFQITKWIPIEIGGLDFSFTNASAFMVATVAAAGAFLYLTTSSRGLVPGGSSRSPKCPMNSWRRCCATRRARRE